MMNVQVMRHLVDPLDAGTMPAVVLAAAERWHGESIVYVRSSANHVFRCVRGGETLYLRLSHGSERTRDYLQAELDFILHCAGLGLTVARPVLSASGTYIGEIPSDAGPYLAVAFEGLRGQQFESDDLTGSQMHAWGRALGGLHRASASFPVRPVRGTWPDQIRELIHALPPDESTLAAVLESELAWLATLPPHGHGLIHGDFELDNLVWDGENVQILDFDACAYSWFAADIAIALQDVYLGDPALRDGRLDAFFAGYASEIPAAADLRQTSARFLNLLLAVKVARVLLAYATTGADHDQPAWLQAMRGRHRQWLSAKRALLRPAP